MLVYKSKCHAATNLKLTSSCILWPNSYTSKSDIASAMTPRMLRKRAPHNPCQDFLLKSRGQDSVLKGVTKASIFSTCRSPFSSEVALMVTNILESWKEKSDESF